MASADDGTLYVAFVANDPRFADPSTFSPSFGARPSAGRSHITTQSLSYGAGRSRCSRRSSSVLRAGGCSHIRRVVSRETCSWLALTTVDGPSRPAPSSLGLRTRRGRRPSCLPKGRTRARCWQWTAPTRQGSTSAGARATCRRHPQAAHGGGGLRRRGKDLRRADRCERRTGRRLPRSGGHSSRHCPRRGSGQGTSLLQRLPLPAKKLTDQCLRTWCRRTTRPPRLSLSNMSGPPTTGRPGASRCPSTRATRTPNVRPCWPLIPTQGLCTWSGTPPPELMNGGDDFDGDLEAFLRSSGDGGRSWSDRTVVNDDGSGANQFEPGLGVAPNGRVDIAWYDFRNSPDGGQSDEGLSDVYYSSLEDEGRTFGPNLRVTDRRSIAVSACGRTMSTAGSMSAWPRAKTSPTSPGRTRATAERTPTPKTSTWRRSTLTGNIERVREAGLADVGGGGSQRGFGDGHRHGGGCPLEPSTPAWETTPNRVGQTSKCR